MSAASGFDISVWVHGITAEEAEALTDAIADLVCAGSGDPHECKRTEWVVSCRISRDPYMHRQVVGIDDDANHHRTTSSSSGADHQEGNAR